MKKNCHFNKKKVPTLRTCWNLKSFVSVPELVCGISSQLITVQAVRGSSPLTHIRINKHMGQEWVLPASYKRMVEGSNPSCSNALLTWSLRNRQVAEDPVHTLTKNQGTFTYTIYVFLSSLSSTRRLNMNNLSSEKKKQVILALVEGNRGSFYLWVLNLLKCNHIIDSKIFV